MDLAAAIESYKEATESGLLTAMTGKVISSASLDVFYSRT